MPITPVPRPTVLPGPTTVDDVLEISVLGPIQLRRNGHLVTARDWHNRDRVRQLLAYLTIHPRAARRRVEVALWPELAADKAAANLRVTLNYLQRVLEPDRGAYQPARFVHATGDALTLDLAHVRVDLHEFERRLGAARAGDDHGDRDALDAYSDAIALVRADYLDDCADGWAEMERFRVTTLVVSGRCRAGELWLQRGEPERAARLAATVLHAEPLQERAARLLAQAAAAQGDRATGRRVLADLLDRLEGCGLPPEPDTLRDAVRAGLSVRPARAA